MLGEFDLIKRYFIHSRHGQRRDDGYGMADERAGVALAQGDDCALLIPTPGHQLAVSVDTSVAGVHFPEDAPPAAIGHRALAVNLSDLAAMGATPRWYVLALTLPDIDPDWLEAFARGMHTLADACGITLVGGDITRGQLAMTITVHGEVPANEAITRTGARVDDMIAVTGPLGGAHAGLIAWRNGVRDMNDAHLHAYLKPWPRLEAGRALRGLASAGLDISDGLLGDLAHLCQASGLGARLEAAHIPVASGLEKVLGDQAFDAALNGGDDYELLFTLPESSLSAARAKLAACGLTLSVIGRMCQAPGVHGIDTIQHGWQHFYGESR
ncbi:thiamine-phosphate kinase [Phytohalomonas tamaricis]|uniref:thiamine-phosphate kinase n=1 Tax=Phytohalomonas tamaricis TaxID=2081032 RepID=UPI000D0B7FBD|nr:thiamine-phosphate kinase [Phytohalomonas tamaricis]